MHRTSVAAACVAFVLTGATSAVAGTTGNGSAQRTSTAAQRVCPPYCKIVMVGLGPENQRVIVTFEDKTGGSNPLRVSYAYNPANDNINQLPTPAENTNPNSGVGIIIKRQCPCTAAQRLTANPISGPDSHGTWAFDPTLPAGSYSIVVTVQAHAVNTKGTGANRMASSSIVSPRDPISGLPAKTMLLTFHVVVDAKGNMTMDPKMPPTATAAPPREPTQ